MAKQNQPPSPFRRIKDAIKLLLKYESGPPEDPYSYVTARRKPRPGGRSASAVLEEPDN